MLLSWPEARQGVLRQAGLLLLQGKRSLRPGKVQEEEGLNSRAGFPRRSRWPDALPTFGASASYLIW
jgi:hypothetical protein